MSIGGDAAHGAGDDLPGEVVGRALHALEPDEDDRVTAHLRTCAECRALLDGTHETMAVLAHAVPALDPPPALRARLVAAVADEPLPPRPRRRSPEVPDDHAGPARAVPSAPSAAPVPDDPSHGLPPDPDDSRVHRRRAAGLLALVALIAGLIVFSAQGAVPSSPDDSSSTVAADRAQRVVASAQQSDPGVHHASLLQPGGSVMAVVLDDGTGPRIVPLDLPSLGPGRMFVLWRVAGRGVTAVGTFDAGGTLTTVPVTPPRNGPTTTPTPGSGSYAVSAEADGPVPVRPSDVVASGPLI